MPRTRARTAARLAIRLAISVVACLTTVKPAARLPAQDQRPVPRITRVARKISAPTDFPSPVDVLQQQEALGQFAFRDRQLWSSLAAADRFRQNGRGDMALMQLQRVLDSDEDGFVQVPTNLGAVSARNLASERIELYGPRFWEAYETVWGRAARTQLEQARKDGDLSAARRISRSYFHTQAGFDATNWLASWWIDHGRYGAAARCWDRLLAAQVHRKRITSLHRLKAATAYRLSKQYERADAVLAEAGVIQAVVAGESQQTGHWLTRVSHERQLDRQTADWTMVMGAPSRRTSREGSFPLLRPLWTYTDPLEPAVAEEDSENQESSPSSRNEDSLAEKMLKWNRERHSSGQDVGIAHFPLVVANQVVFRDSHGVRSLDKKTGQPQWWLPCETSLAKLWQAQPRDRGRRPDLDWALAGNATWGMLSSDGRRVFAIDHLEMAWNRPSVIGGKVVADPCKQRRKSNKLIAIDLQSKDQVSAPLWSVGGTPPENSKETSALEGYFFLGPPLPLHDRLFVVAEHNHRLKLVALDAATGALIWKQGVALVDLPIESDRSRYTLACTPSYANGVLVCATQLGVLVGVDETTGSLMWVYYYGDPQPSRKFGRLPYRRRTSYGHAGYPDLPIIAENCVVSMPRQSDFVHCLDLLSGEKRWRVSRDDGEYIATVHGDTVLVIGRHNCRGLSLSDGTELWTTRPGICSGSGIHIGASYILPLADGSVANLDIATGRKIGFTRTPTSTRIGNLALQDGVIYSMAGTQLAAFPQAGSLLKEIENKQTVDHSLPHDLLIAGELQLILGELDKSKNLLRSALEREMPAEGTEDAEELLREALYLQLKSPSSEEAELLAELNQLARSPIARGRYLILKAEFELRQGRFIEAVDAALQFAELDLKQPIPLTSNRAHAVTTASWAADFLARIEAEADPDSVVWLNRQISEALDEVTSTREITEIRQFLACFSAFPQADSARLLLAELLAQRGRYQAAEFLLLHCRRCPDLEISGAATWQLAQIYRGRHVHADATRMLNELNGRFRGVYVTDGTNGSQAVELALREDPTLGDSLRRPKPLDRPTTVTISEHRWPQFDLEKIYANFWRPLSVPHRCNFDLRPTGRQRPSTDLWQVDRQLGIAVGVLHFPDGAVPPISASVRQSFTGHFFPIGSKQGGVMYGMSLLNPATTFPEDRIGPPGKHVLWTTVAAGSDEVQGEIRPGPTGLNFCAFQSTRELLVVEPAGGRVLWRRSDIQPGGGLFADRQLGLFGDEKVLVLFGRDKKTFTVYETTTGRELNQGRLDIEVSQFRRTFGRNFLHVAKESDGSRRLRLWDPLTDEFLRDEPLVSSEGLGIPRNPLIVPVQFSESFAYQSKLTGGIRIVDGQSGRVELSIPLSPEETTDLRQISVFGDQDRYYVNLQRNVRGIWRSNSFAGETYLSSVRVNGDLRAYNRRTGEQEWSQRIPQCVVLQLPHFPEPLLVTLSRISWKGRYFLQVAAYHAQTGEQLGARRDILSHRIVHAHYDAATRQLELRSLKSRISLKIHHGRMLNETEGLAELP